MRPTLPAAMLPEHRTRAMLAAALLCVAAPSALPMNALAQDGPEPGDPAVWLDSVISILEAHQDASRTVGLSAAIASGGRVLWSGGFGYANLQHRVEAGPEMVSRLGSVSKSVAAVMAMALQQEGRTAENAIHRSAAHPPHLLLPVVGPR